MARKIAKVVVIPLGKYRALVSVKRAARALIGALDAADERDGYPPSMLPTRRDVRRALARLDKVSAGTDEGGTGRGNAP